MQRSRSAHHDFFFFCFSFFFSLLTAFVVKYLIGSAPHRNPHTRTHALSLYTKWTFIPLALLKRRGCVFKVSGGRVGGLPSGMDGLERAALTEKSQGDASWRPGRRSFTAKALGDGAGSAIGIC